jgi:hypothetical protein
MNRLIAVVAVLVAATAPAAALDVELVNRSRPIACAEVDNVDFRLSGPSPLAFTIEATFPAYFEPDIDDRTAPVWDHCEGFAADDPVFRSTPARLVLYEDDRWLLTAVRKPSFWRPAIVPVRVAGESFRELHLLQLHRKRENTATVEVLVLYPPDGYWRAKPLTPRTRLVAGHPDTVFGSSFLIGPIEEDGRPFVDLAAVAFLPEADRFELRFVRGGTAAVELREVSVAGLRLDVRIERAAPTGEFAALRSMFVEETMADTARVRWTTPAGGDGEAAVLAPLQRLVDDVTFARDVPSRHNTSAPDLRLFGFRPLDGTGG